MHILHSLAQIDSRLTMLLARDSNHTPSDTRAVLYNVLVAIHSHWTEQVHNTRPGDSERLDDADDLVQSSLKLILQLMALYPDLSNDFAHTAEWARHTETTYTRRHMADCLNALKRFGGALGKDILSLELPIPPKRGHKDDTSEEDVRALFQVLEAIRVNWIAQKERSNDPQLHIALHALAQHNAQLILLLTGTYPNQVMNRFLNTRDWAQRMLVTNIPRNTDETSRRFKMFNDAVGEDASV